MLNLSNLGKHNNKRKKRVGRGSGSGHGQTSGKGNKGQNARAGGGVRPGFEGGQMPYIRRVPKRGFNNPLREEIAILNLEVISKMEENEINIDILKQKGLIKNKEEKIKILGQGEIGRKINLTCNLISKNARKKIEGLGGTVRII